MLKFGKNVFFPYFGPGVCLGGLIPCSSDSAGPDQQGSGSGSLAIPSRPNQTEKVVESWFPLKSGPCV